MEATWRNRITVNLELQYGTTHGVFCWVTDAEYLESKCGAREKVT